MLFYSRLHSHSLTPIAPLEQLPISLLPALQLGVSAFTTLRSDASLCWRRAHLKRLHQNAHDMLGGLPSFREFAAHMDVFFEEQGASRFVELPHRVRITLIPEGLELSILYQRSVASTTPWSLFIELQTTALPAYPSTLEALPTLEAHLSRYQTLTPELKKGSQLDALLLRQRLAAQGEDVLWINDTGELTELTHANFFVHHHTKGWMTPPKPQCLAGITRQQVLNAAKQCKLQVHEVPISIDDLDAIDLAVATNSIQGWARVASLKHDEKVYSLEPSHDCLKEAQMLYKAWQALVSAENKSCYTAN